MKDLFMIITTTPTVEGHPVTQYLGIVNGETIAGINIMRDIGAGFRNAFWGALRRLRARACSGS